MGSVPFDKGEIEGQERVAAGVVISGSINGSIRMSSVVHGSISSAGGRGVLVACGRVCWKGGGEQCNGGG